MDWKPSVCWQVPIRLEHSTDESGHVTSRLREWKRRDWGEGGDEFGWWCTEEPDAFVGSEPLYVSAKDDIVELVGEHIYDLMVSAARAPELGAAPPPGSPPPVTFSDVPGTSCDGQSSVSSSSSKVTPYFSASAAYSSSSSSCDVDGRRTVTEAQIKGSRTGLLQFSRLFEPAMTTLLHDRAPTL